MSICVFSSQTKHHRFSVTLGKNAINETDPTVEQTFSVEEIIIHEGFDNSEGNFNNDIGTKTPSKKLVSQLIRNRTMRSDQ